jgi:hypothetical protein
VVGIIVKLVPPYSFSNLHKLWSQMKCAEVRLMPAQFPTRRTDILFYIAQTHKIEM